MLQPGQGPVIRPKGVDLHYEVELALVMGKKVKDLAPDDEQGALDAIESESTGRLTAAVLGTMSALPSLFTDPRQKVTPCQST